MQGARDFRRQRVSLWRRDHALGGALVLPIARRVGRSLDPLQVSPEVAARDREATGLALASAALGELTGR
jgi:hypothetical protein